MFRRYPIDFVAGFHPAQPLIQLWALRCMVHLIPANKMQKIARGNLPEVLAVGLGLMPGDQDEDDSSLTYPRIREQLLSRLDALEADLDAGRIETRYCKGLHPLAHALGLDATESCLLQFASAINLELVLREAIGLINTMDRRLVIQLLGVVLGLDPANVKTALSRQGVLARSGVLSLCTRDSLDVDCMFDMLNHELPGLLLEADTQLGDVLKTVIQEATRPTLSLADFPHLQPQLGQTLAYLRHVSSERMVGVNILLYGPPGTGKTELVKVLARELGVPLYEVSASDSDGEPSRTHRRMASLMLSQSCLSQTPSLLLFDEVEEVFQGGYRYHDGTPQPKAWVNQRLETNAVPTVWVTNSIEYLDPAYARRFDVVMEVPVPPEAQRKKVILSAAGNFLDSTTLHALSEHTALSPALVARAARVAKTLTDAPQGLAGASATMLNLVNQTLRVQGLSPVNQGTPGDIGLHYSLGHLNPDIPLDGLLAALNKHPHGRFCLYGPPGTGKSALVRWLAKQLNKPLLLRRASDLLSQWVGGNEKNIAQAFQEAIQQEAVLLIDEVDTFLQPRQNAVRGWEASMVNEMLTQLESFQGLMFATTNLMQGMDAAAMRRFDVKVNLRAPTADQLHGLLAQVVQGLALEAPSVETCQHLAKLSVTPGDVAAVVRRQAFVPLYTQATLLDALVAEARFKPESPGQTMGFL